MIDSQPATADKGEKCKASEHSDFRLEAHGWKVSEDGIGNCSYCRVDPRVESARRQRALITVSLRAAASEAPMSRHCRKPPTTRTSSSAASLMSANDMRLLRSNDSAP